MNSTRVLIVAVMLPFLGSEASAQLKVAPPPRSAISELAKEYVRLGMPVPPKDAVLVRIDDQYWFDDIPDPAANRHYFAFRTGSAARPQYLVVDWRQSVLTPLEPVHPKSVEVVRAGSLSIRGHLHLGEDLLYMAAILHLHDEPDFADRFLTASLENREFASPRDAIRERAWAMYEFRLQQPRGDRRAVLKHMSDLMDRCPEFRTPEHLALAASLRETVQFVRKAKPGTAESLIDDLMDHCRGELDYRRTGRGTEAYGKLSAMGFDAVPALIDHVQDNRLTRSRAQWLGCMHIPHWLTVGHVCSDILCNLSARKIEGAFTKDDRNRYSADEVRRWFNNAKKIGEEKWLLEHAALPAGARTPEWSVQAIRHVLGVKYPKSFLDFVRAKPNRPADLSFDHLAIAASTLPAKTRIALLLEAVSNPQCDEWYDAMPALWLVDRAEHRRVLLASLGKLKQLEPEKMSLAMPFIFLEQLELADDAECWSAFAQASRHFSVEAMSAALNLMGDPVPAEWDWRGRFRTERLRFVTGFLNDPAVGDLAAANIASMLGMRVWREEGEAIAVDPHQDRGAVRRLLLRAGMAAAAERELERLSKPN